MHRLEKERSDEDLLRAIARNDEKAFEALFNKYWKWAYRVTRSSLRSDSHSSEIVQDIFLGIWERRHSLNIRNFSSYLSVAVKYKVIDFIKHQVTRKEYANHYKLYCRLEEEETLDAVQFNELMSAIESSVNQLPEKTQTVFRLNRLEGRSISEIADKMKLSEKSIQYHLTQSLRHLRIHLKDFYLLLLLIVWR